MTGTGTLPVLAEAVGAVIAPSSGTRRWRGRLLWPVHAIAVTCGNSPRRKNCFAALNWQALTWQVGYRDSGRRYWAWSWWRQPWCCLHRCDRNERRGHRSCRTRRRRIAADHRGKLRAGGCAVVSFWHPATEAPLTALQIANEASILRLLTRGAIDDMLAFRQTTPERYGCNDACRGTDEACAN
jgi:hypothetical protein